ncbi:uncharacterized protein LOC127367994 [Dicentrarchus labrax]|uniref:uncharacterized protein LOC127367994 n=1 Tax=Dicentrarchus labrax TaxID=13489 RepID=UPI0021F668CD|nr:uncharacterized protein LOC127367994 [Dicentrarchus labrax]
MARFRWTQIALFLMLLHLKAITGQIRPVAVRDGDEVTLTCDNGIQDQDECSSTAWFVDYSVGQKLLGLGQTGERVKDKSGRLRVTANCSLVIKKVTAKDVGHYTCRQVAQIRLEHTFLFLFVINMTEHEDNDEVMLSCSVPKDGECRHTVNWLYEGERVAEDNKDMKISHSDCSATVTFLTSYLKHQASDYHKLFKCEAHHHYIGKAQLFTFRPQSSGEDPTTSVLTEAPTTTSTTPSMTMTSTTTSTTPSTTTSTTTSTTQEARTDCSVLNYIMLVMRVAELLLITVITVLLIRARENQRPPDDSTVLNSEGSRAVRRSGPAASQLHRDEDGHDGTVNYENVGEPSASVRLNNLHTNINSPEK